MENQTSKRKQLLMSASTIVKNEGVHKLTLEAVAKEAGVSKGGLLYHFPSKEALIKGMVDELTANYVSEMNKLVETDEQLNGKWTKAYVKSTFNELEADFEMSSALMAAIFANPELLKDFQLQYEDWQTKIENDGLNPVRSTIARLVADGLWYGEIFGLAPLEKGLKDEIYKELLSWTREGKN